MNLLAIGLLAVPPTPLAYPLNPEESGSRVMTNPPDDSSLHSSMAEARTVLLVDDYPDALDVWEIFLRTEGFRVLTAVTGQQALSIAAADIPDLIVLDLDLPDLSGFEVARELRSRTATRHIPLIAATGFSHVVEDSARQSGFDSVLVKPCDPDALIAEIHRLLAAHGALPPAPIEQ